MTGQNERLDVSVVVIAYNTASLLERCLRSVAPPSGCRAEVIVLDNASTDGSAELVRRRFPTARLLESPANLGFAAGVNHAAREATGRYLLLLNPDAELGAGALDELVTFADRHPGHGIYGGRVVTPAGDLDPRSCFGLPTPWSSFCFGLGLSTAFARSRLFDPESLGGWRRDSVRQVGAVSGAFMLVERSLWEQLGGFDDTYFMYGEDIDLCARARLLGARPVIDPAATAVHAVGASSTAAGKAVLLFTGKATYVRRRWSQPAQWWGLAMLRAGVALRAALSRRGRGARAEVWPALWASRRTWAAGYRGRPVVGEAT